MKRTPETEMKTRRADAVRNRAAVLTAARKTMARRGLDVGMDEIARSAGVGVGTVYRHFPTKDELIAALADQRFETLAGYAREALEEDDPTAAFENFLMRGGKLQADDRALSEIMNERGKMMGKAAERAGVPALAGEVLKRAQDAGAIRLEILPEDIPMLMCGLASLTTGNRAPFRGRNSWKRYLGIMLDGLRTGGKSDLPPHR